MATSRIERSRCCGVRLEGLDPVPVGVLEPAASGPGRRGARAGGRGLAAAVLAGEQAVLEREVGQYAEPELLARRDDLGLDRRGRAGSSGSARRRTARDPPVRAVQSASATCQPAKFEQPT